MSLPFVKMNGLGNDFVIVPGAFEPSAARARGIADRERGVGCDQLIVVSRAAGADAAMTVWNADGGPAAGCGNAARCVASLVMDARGRDEVVLQSGDRRLYARRGERDAIAVDMGAPGLDWRDIPLAWEMDTREVMLRIDPLLRAPGCVSMGNPHVVFFVPDAEAAPVVEAGPMIEHHWLFPDRANVGFASIIDPNRIRLRVWERGAGLTAACGSGACAAVVAAHRRGLAGRQVVVTMDGGDLAIDWRESDDHVLMTGPVAIEFTGWLPPEAPAS